MTQFSMLLAGEARRLSITLPPESMRGLNEFFDILMEWKDTFNLIGRLSPEEIVSDLFADSLLGLFAVSGGEGLELADVGCGAGFPGMVIKIADPSLKVTLMDSSRKKIDFLRMAIDRLKLKNITPVPMRAEDAGRNKDFRDHFDFVTAKGVAPLPTLVELCGPLAAKGGRMVLWKGSNLKNEMEALGDGYRLLGLDKPEIRRFVYSESGKTTNIACFKKITKTGILYPRTFQAIKRKPLTGKSPDKNMG